MAKTSRSSKKQPAFDPSELSDLIFSPAVGSGVGSHLFGNPPIVPGDAEVSTVDMLESTTVDMSGGTGSAPHPPSDLSTVAVTDMTTVVDSKVTTEANNDMATVDRYRDDQTLGPAGDEAGHSGSSSRKVIYWITENGNLVPQGRVKRIVLAKDVINSAEESVYDTLWSAKSIQSDGEAFRVVQAGYDYLGKKTGLSKKTIQRIVAKLIDKDFLAIERPADIYQRSSTMYRVFGYKAVVERHILRGRSHVAKVGPGFSYVRRLEDPRPGGRPVYSSHHRQL